MRIRAPYLLGMVIFEYTKNLLCRGNVPTLALSCTGGNLLCICDGHATNQWSHQHLAHINHYHIHALDKKESE